MDAETNSTSATELDDASLVRGGPSYRIQQALRLIRPNKWNLGRRVAAVLAIAVLPPLLLTVFLNPAGLHSFLTDYRVYARTLMALPALLLGEVLLEARFRAVLSYIRQAHLLDAPDTAYMREVVAKVARLRDGFLPELLILVFVLVRIYAFSWGLVDATPWLAVGTAPNFHITPAGWYSVFVTAPLWNFLFGLALWRWLLWTYFAFQLSRRKLKVVVTHPDEHGGLGFLGLSVSAFAPIAFTIVAVIGSTWREDLLYHGQHLLDLKFTALTLVAIIALIVFLPLLFFVPGLTAQRRRGLMEYGILGQFHSAEFHDKWLTNRTGREDEFLQAPEITALANYGKTYETIEQLKPFPVDVVSLYSLAAAVVLPALPVVLAQIPLKVVLEDLFKALR